MKSILRILAAAVLGCALSPILPAATKPGVIWNLRAVQPSFNDLRGVATNGGSRAVAVGAHGTILISDDHGVVWNKRNADPVIDLVSVAWTGSRFVAVGQSGSGAPIVMSSPEGLNWYDSTCLTPRFAGARFASVAANSSVAVAVGSSNLIAYSPDLREWTMAQSEPCSLNEVAWTGGQFLAVGSKGHVRTSPDGKTWASHDVEAHSSVNLRGVAWNSSLIVAVGYDASTSQSAIFTSLNAVHWTRVSDPDLGAYNLASVVWTGEAFVAMDYYGNTLLSLNGSSWSHYKLAGNGFDDLCWDGSRLIAVGYNGAIHITSEANPKLSDWDERISGDAFPAFADMAAGDVDGTERTVMVGANGLVVTSGTACATFAAPVYPVSEHLNGVTHTTYWNMHFIAVGSNGTLITSADGLSWSSQTTDTSNRLNAIAWFVAKFPLLPFGIAVGDGGTIVKSTTTDGWQTQTSPTSRKLFDVAVGSAASKGPSKSTRIAVAVGQDGTIVHSTDGENWTLVADSKTTDDLRGIAFGNDRFVAVGNNGTILASDDASKWTLLPKIESEPQLRGVHWAGDQFVAVGNSGFILTSDDGTHWVRRYGAGRVPLVAATSFSSGRIAALSPNNLVATSNASLDFAEWIGARNPPPGQDGPDDDPNRDGVSNLVAAALDMRPVLPARSWDFQALPRIAGGSPGTPLRIHLRPSHNMPADISYVVEASETMAPGTWTELLRHRPGQLCGTGDVQIIAFNDCGTEMTLVLPGKFGDHAAYFVRLRAELVP